KRADFRLIGIFPPVEFGRHGIAQRQFDGALGPMWRHDRPRISVPSALEKVSNHIGIENGPHRLERQQFRVAGSRADPDQASSHIPGLANALSAAAVMALPPNRPSTMAKGTP